MNLELNNMERNAANAIFDYGSPFQEYTSVVAAGSMTVTISPTNDKSLNYVSSISGKSDDTAAMLTIYESGATSLTAIWSQTVGNAAFNYPLGDDFRTESGLTTVVTCGATTAGTVNVIGSKRTPFAYKDRTKMNEGYWW